MPELLNNLTHRDLRIVTRRGVAWGDGVMSCPATPDEFRGLQAHYPILFQQDAEGQFLPIVLFGLEDGRNLFLDEAAPNGWDAELLPLAMRRMPFSIGVERPSGELRVMVDMASPRVSPQGEPVFLPQGGHAPLLEEASSVLRALHEGLQAAGDFTQALANHGLLEPFVLEVARPDGTTGRLQGLHMIHEERLAALDAATVAALHQAEYLQPMYMAVASLSNLSALIRRHLARGG